MKKYKKFSIIINNYNYDRYLQECIDSALSQIHNSFEVIVVDDGSTDKSKFIIEKYRDRIIKILKNNGGQGSAYNAGFTASCGEWVIFLDSDDILHSEALAIFEASATEKASKLHAKLEIMLPNNRLSGQLTPGILHSGWITDIVERFGCYGSPPGSGNAYRREFLNQVMPMPESTWRIAADAYLIHLSPFYGEICATNRPTGVYRLHNRPGSSHEFALNNSPSHPSDSLARSLESSSVMLKELQNRGWVKNGYVLGTTPSEIKVRLISKKFYSQKHPIKEDNYIKILIDGIRSIWTWPNQTVTRRIIFTSWIIVVATLPKSIARYPAKLIFNR